MNLNFFTSEFPFNISETFIENEIPILAPKFDKVKIFPHFFINSDSRNVPENCVIEQIGDFEFERLSFRYHIIIILFFITEFFKSPKKRYYLSNSAKWLSLLKIAAKKSKFIEINDLILKDSVNYSFWMNDWALVLTFLKKRKYIKSFFFRCGGFDIWNERHPNNYMPFRGLIYKYANQVYPNTKIGETYIKKLGLYPHKIECKYWGTTDYGLGKFDLNDEFTIVSVSNVIPLKRVELIIEILSYLNFDAKWIHFGDGDELPKVKEIAKRKLNINFEFKGRISNKEVLNFYLSNTVNLFITTSSTEGLPVSIQEAISFGMPVIATDVGGVSEIISSSNGYLIDRDFNPEEVADIINNFKESDLNTLKRRKDIRNDWEKKFKASFVYNEFYYDITSNN